MVTDVIVLTKRIVFFERMEEIVVQVEVSLRLRVKELVSLRLKLNIVEFEIGWLMVARMKGRKSMTCEYDVEMERKVVKLMILDSRSYFWILMLFYRFLLPYYWLLSFYALLLTPYPWPQRLHPFLLHFERLLY